MSAHPTPREVFFSYAEADEQLTLELEKHLRVLEREGLITIWHKGRISPGTDRDRQMSERLSTASIILLLLSADFMHSDSCYSMEMRQALARHEIGDAYVIPILLRPVENWQGTPIGSLQTLPSNGIPVTSWSDHDAVFVDIAKGIRSVLQNGKLPNTKLRDGRLQRECIQTELAEQRGKNASEISVRRWEGGLEPSAYDKEKFSKFFQKTVDELGWRNLEASESKQEEAGVSADAKNSNAVPLIVEKQSTSQKSRFPIFRPPTTGIFFLVAVAIIIVLVSFASAFGGIIGVKLSGLSLLPSPTTNVSVIPTPSSYGNPQFHPPNTALIFCGGARDGGKGWEGSSPDLSYYYTGSDNQGHNCATNSYALTPPQHILIYRPDGGPQGGWPIPLSAKSVDVWIYISPVWHSAQAQYSLQFDGPSQALRSWPPLDQQFCDHWLILGNALIPQEATHVKLITESTNTTPGYFADNAAALDFHPFVPTSPAVPSTTQQCKKGSSPMQ